MLTVVYVALATVIGLAGRKRYLGFVGYFLLSLLITPIPPLLFLLITQRRFVRRHLAMLAQSDNCPRCGHNAKTIVAGHYCNLCGIRL